MWFSVKLENMFTIGAIFLVISTSLANPLFVITADEDSVNEYGGFRLPSHQVPSDYNLTITLTKDIFEGKVIQFNGTVEITFNVTKEVDFVQLHAPMQINNIEISDATLTITARDVNATSSIRTLQLNGNLSAGTYYTLKIDYTANIEVHSMSGLYRSSYVDDDNVTQYLLTTQFEPTHARLAFPCFDEPSYKATYTISFLYPKDLGLNALGNTPIAEKVDENDFEKVTFEKTPLISTYFIAFIISKFTCSSAAAIEDTLPHSVCSRPESESTRILATNYSTQILEALGTYTNIKYSEMLLEKMTQAAIPDFSAGAMENWGLVTYRESLLLWDENESSDKYKQSILTVIAHEFAHQWFGDYVTFDWWDNIFLNEGFATYFEYFILSQVEDFAVLELDKQFVIDGQQLALANDASESIKEITAKVSSPDEISAKFSVINYNKAGSIIRMIENFMTPEKFQAGLSDYLKSKAFSNSSPKDLLDALELKAPTANLPNDITFSNVVDHWLNKPGYPLVTVSIYGEDVTLKQERFLYLGADPTTKWNVPITYTIDTDENKFENVVPTNWLTGANLTIPSLLKDNTSWIILNNQESAYYRVNYKKELWDRIAAGLLKNHTEIHVLNRAQIVDDSLNIARAGLLKYSEAITILEYLKAETDYYPWLSGSTEFEYLLFMVGEDSDLGHLLKEKLLELIDEAYKTVSFDNNNGEHIYMLKRELFLSIACRYGHQSCISNAVSQFQSWKNSGKSVDRNLKNVVYCNGLRYSNNPNEDFGYLLNKLQNTTLSTEEVTIEVALTCVKNTELLKTYLGLSLNESSGIRYQQITTIWSSIISKNPLGLQAVLEYLAEEHEKIRTSYPSVPSLLQTVANSISNNQQLAQFKEIIQSDEIDESYRYIGQRAITSAILNLGWLQTIKDDLQNFLQKPYTGKSSRLITWSPTLLVFFAFLKLFVI